MASFQLARTGSMRMLGLIWIVVLPIMLVIGMVVRRRTGWDALPRRCDPSRRIHALFPPSLLQRLGPLRDEQFEPEAIMAPLPAPGSAWEWAAIFAVMLAGAIATSFILPVQTGAAFMWGGAGAAGAAALAALGVWRQTWFRFSPGRLDILVFRPWKDEAIRVRSYDLRTTPIVLDLRWRRLILDDRGKATTISLGGTFPIARAAFLVLRAAISTAPTPDLPMDRLHD